MLPGHDNQVEEGTSVTLSQDKTLEVSFSYASDSDLSPMVTIHNARILIPSLSDQVVRFGLHKPKEGSSTMIGHLKGGRENFINMIYSYGFKIDFSTPLN